MNRRRASGTAWQMLILLGVSAAGMIAARVAYEQPLPLNYAWSNHVESSATEKGMRTVTVGEAKEIADSFSHLVLDARRHSDYIAGRIPGAMSLPEGEFEEYFGMVSPLLSETLPIMVYCSGLECDESLKLGEVLIRSGFTNITLFAGGMADWTNAGYAVEQ